MMQTELELTAPCGPEMSIPVSAMEAERLLLFLGYGAMIIRKVERVGDLDEALHACQAADDRIEWCKVMRGNQVVAGFVRRGEEWLVSARR
jgi:hypothetical protein